MTDPAPEQRVVTPSSQAEFDAIRALCRDYRAFLMGLSPYDAEIVETFYPEGKYADVLAALEDAHSVPRGAARLALMGDAPAGCGMVHLLAPDTAEIKRVWVAEEARGRGLGRALMQALIEDCRALGAARILMDTSRPLKAAQTLYLDLGFRARGPYQPVPDIARGHLLFFEMEL